MSVHKYTTKHGDLWMVRYRDDTHRLRKEKGYKTKKQAQDREAELKKDLRHGTYIDPKSARITVNALAKDWLAHNAAMSKPTSHRPIESAWEHHVKPRWGNVPVSAVRTKAIKTWIAELVNGDDTRKPLSATMVRRCHGILAGILDDAVADRRIVTNPARDKTNKIKLPTKRRKSHVYLTHDEVHTLAANSSHPEIVLTLAYTGLRWGELTGLQVKHINFSKRQITVERNIVVMAGGKRQDEGLKTGERRTVSFPEFLTAPLATQCQHKGREDFVFLSEDGDILKPPNATYGWFAAAVKKTGLPRITPHDLRHTTASLAVASNANVKAVQRMLGHKSAAMTLDVYTDLFDNELDRVASALNDEAELAMQRTSGGT